MKGNTISSACVATFLFATMGIARDVVAEIPEWSLRDYVHTTWTHRDGVALAPVVDITQTTDGYLWFVSQGGLVRFDGIRFLPIPVPCDRVNSVEKGENGILWVMCREPRVQLFRRTPLGQLTEVSLGGLQLTGGPTLFRDRRNRLWILQNIVARLDPDGSLRQVPGPFGDGVKSPVEDSDGTLWLTKVSSIVRIRDERVEELPFQNVLGMTPAPTGGVFVCARDRIGHLNGTSETVIARAPPEVAFMDASGCLAVDAAGRLWVGTRQHGIALVQQNRVETFLSRNEIGGSIGRVFIDREDNVWVASSAGLHRFRKPHARLLSSTVTEMPPNPIGAFVDSRDNVWINGTGQFVRLSLASGSRQVFTSPRIWTFHDDETGRIWLATDNEIGYLEGDTFRPVRDATGAPVRNVRAFSKDGEGHLWAVVEDIGIYQITPGLPRRVYDDPAVYADLVVSPQHGVWVTLSGGGVRQFIGGRAPVFHDTEQGADIFGSVLSLIAEGDTLWMGDNGGLLRWRNGRWTRWTREHGLPGSGSVQEIARDRAGRFWLMTNGGIIVLSHGDLDATEDGKPGPLRFVQIGTLDRVIPHPGPPRNSPRVGVDSSGRLYFATIDSVAVVDPATVTASSLRPTIVLESVVVDNESVDPGATARLTVPSLLQFGYTSLSLRNPENIRFRYKLEGYDSDWIEAGTSRQATYGTLPPGSYRFHVIGSGSEGVWNDEGATFAFRIVPLLYNTWGFRALVVGIVVAVIGVAYRLRVRRLTQQMHMRFEERLAERTRIARDLHDTLLQSTIAASLHLHLANESLSSASSSPEVQEALAPLGRAMQLLSRVAEEGRATVSGLRTAPASGDIAEVLQRTANREPNYRDIDFRVVVDGPVRPLKPQIFDEICRIACEAVVNAYRHARARHIEVELVYTRTRFRCVVRDDGQGIDEGVLRQGLGGHWGLTGMRERAERAGGELHVRSRATAGTEVELSVPGRLAYS